MELKQKLRLVSPTVLLTTLLSLVLGPIYFPTTYIFGLTAFFSYFLLFTVLQALRFSQSARKVMKSVSAPLYEGSDPKQQQPTQLNYVHAIVIPNYNESLGTLEGTLDILASHPGAETNYLVVLAMEERESEHKMKANTLIAKYRNKFMRIFSTSHPADIPGEHKGKGSNANHGVRVLRNYLRTPEEASSLNIHPSNLINVDTNRVIITICDADTHIPAKYFVELDQTYGTCSDPHYTIFCPPMFFGRNSLQIPSVVRMMDLMWSIAVAQNLSEKDGINFPCCAYSLSMKLAEEVDYWDVDDGAIGEDFHMFLKCFFRTNARARAHPIFVPINITNITCDTYLGTIRARFLQAKRHFDGVADIAYALCAAWTHRNTIPFSSNLKMCRIVLETHIFPPNASWFLTLAVPLATYLQPLYGENPIMLALMIFLNVASVLCTLMVFYQLYFYERMHSKIVAHADNLFLGGCASPSTSLLSPSATTPRIVQSTFFPPPTTDDCASDAPEAMGGQPAAPADGSSPNEEPNELGICVHAPALASPQADVCVVMTEQGEDTKDRTVLCLSPQEATLSDNGSTASLEAATQPLDNVKMAALVLRAQKRKLSNLLDYIALPITAWMFVTIPSMMASLKVNFFNVNDMIVSTKPEIYVV